MVLFNHGKSPGFSITLWYYTNGIHQWFFEEVHVVDSYQGPLLYNIYEIEQNC